MSKSTTTTRRARNSNKVAPAAAAPAPEAVATTTDDDTTEAPVPPLPVTSKPTQVAVGLVIEKNRPEQNGIKRPSAGGRCRAVWDALDAYRAETGELPTAKTVRALAADEGWNPNNASIEFYQWRKFNGITGRAAKPATVAAD
jgi:hypothetical protein